MIVYKGEKPMREKFCEWYRFICMEPTNDQLKFRWESLQEYCDNEEPNILELTKMFFELPVDNSIKDKFVEYYINKDMTFKTDNDQEIALLAGATLADMIERNEHTKEIVLAITCISFFKQDAIIPEVQSIAADKLADIASSIREVKAEQNMHEIKNTGVKDLKKSLEEETWNQENIKVLLTTLTKIESNITTLLNNQKQLCKSIDVYKEDSNILAWLIGGWSNDLDKQLNDEITQSNVALILGKELADLVERIPGPYSAKAFLKKMLACCKLEEGNISLIEIVDALDESWKKHLLDIYPLIDKGENTPILLAISKALEVNEPQVWKHSYKKLMGIDAEEVVGDSLSWAYQIYLECLLIKYYNSEE